MRTNPPPPDITEQEITQEFAVDFIEYHGVGLETKPINAKKEYFKFEGYNIHQPTQGIKEKDISWKKFAKKLLSGRPLAKGISVRTSAKNIVEVNSKNSVRALIRMIKSHGNKFNYVDELTKIYNKKYGTNKGLRTAGLSFIDGDY
jgi:hypothetical protein